MHYFQLGKCDVLYGNGWIKLHHACYTVWRYTGQGDVSQNAMPWCHAWPAVQLFIVPNGKYTCEKKSVNTYMYNAHMEDSSVKKLNTETRRGHLDADNLTLGLLKWASDWCCLYASACPINHQPIFLENSY